MKKLSKLFKIAPETKKKVIKSLMIASSGFIVGTVAILMSDPAVIAWLAAHPIGSLFIASFLPVLLNTLNEWRKNQDRLDNL